MAVSKLVEIKQLREEQRSIADILEETREKLVKAPDERRAEVAMSELDNSEEGEEKGRQKNVNKKREDGRETNEIMGNELIN